jgi:hypothetical protein
VFSASTGAFDLKDLGYVAELSGVNVAEYGLTTMRSKTHKTIVEELSADITGIAGFVSKRKVLAMAKGLEEWAEKCDAKLARQVKEGLASVEQKAKAQLDALAAEVSDTEKERPGSRRGGSSSLAALALVACAQVRSSIDALKLSESAARDATSERLSSIFNEKTEAVEQRERAP